MIKFERNWIKAEVWKAEPERDVTAAVGSVPAIMKVAEQFSSVDQSSTCCSLQRRRADLFILL